MPSYQSEKSVTLNIPAQTFLEIDNFRKQKGITLIEAYSDAMIAYLTECHPERKKVYGTPTVGRRIRAYLDNPIYLQASELATLSGFNLRDLMYTALEYYLEKKTKSEVV